MRLPAACMTQWIPKLPPTRQSKHGVGGGGPSLVITGFAKPDTWIRFQDVHEMISVAK